MLRANSWAACGGSACAVAALGNDVLVVEQLSELFARIDNRDAGTGRNGVILASNFDGRPVIEMTTNNSKQARIGDCRREIQAWLARTQHPYEAGRAAKSSEGLAVDQVAVERSERATRFKHRDIRLV